ncbi:hypothetical protein V498_02182 [Pseudogymnoascus sp. VKM F-4517 (FW-2822)]|nr:hypothetical protein V498_02182 [Pseudogymnoascus sp. VKM F-4517 (FW-2822)]
MDSDSIATTAEDAKPSRGSNDGEAPPADNGLDEPPRHSHQPETTPKTNNNEETKENISQSKIVGAGQSVTSAEGPRPSHDSNDSAAAQSADGGQQELDTHIHQSDAVDAPPVTIYDGATKGNATQSDSPTINQKMTGTDSTRHSLSAVPDVDFDVVEETRIENLPIHSGPASQSDWSLPYEPGANLDTERNLEPEPDPKHALQFDPAAASVSNPELDPASNSESGEEDETRHAFKVRLTQMSSKNLEPRDIELNRALGQAIADGELEAFNHLLESGASLQSRFDDEGDDGELDQSTLFLAARLDQSNIAERILEIKFDKDFLEDNKTNGWTPAHIAAQNNSVNVLRHILEAGEKIGRKQYIVDFGNEDNETPLHIAARRDRLEIVGMLLDNNADLRIKEIDGQTPLHSAAYNGSKEVFARLLSVAGAENLLGEPEEDGWTVLHCAAWGGIDVGPLLNDKSILKLLTKETQLTPLLVAALGGHKDIVLSFIAAGSDILAKSTDGRTVFHMAAKSGNIDTLRELAGRLDRDTLISRDNNGGTALCSAAAEEEYDAVCFLMEHAAFALPRLKLGAPAKVNHRDAQEVKKFLVEFIDNKSESELDSLVHWHLIVHWAVFFGWESIAKTCFERPGDLFDSKTKSGETLLHVAACNGHAGVVDQLMDYFKKRGSVETNVLAKVSDKKNDEIIPLHFAAANDYVRTMRRLLEGSVSDQVIAESKTKNDKPLLYSASWDQLLVESRNGETALYFAARNGHESVVSFIFRWLDKYPLLQSIIRKRTKDGKTPLSQATENGHQDVAKALLEVLTKHDFNQDPKAAWDELTEVARTGLEHYVELIVDKGILLPSIPETNPQNLFPNQEWSGLLWVVYYGHYEAVWWLLRRNGPPILTSQIIKDTTHIIDVLLDKVTNNVALTATETSEVEVRYREIKDCLDNPPRVENVYDQFDPDGFPSVPQLSPEKKMVCDKYKATIVDFYDKADHVSFAALNRSIVSTIYDESVSLDDIMADAGMDRREPKSLNGAIKVIIEPQAPSESPAPPAGTQKKKQSSGQKQVHDDRYKFRWIHVPANNRQPLEANPQLNMEDKIDQTSRGGEVVTKPGTNTVPNTVQVKSLPEKESAGAEMDRTSSGTKYIALYMPFLTFSEANVGDGKCIQGHDTSSLVVEYGKGTLHELRTLDRYYYSSLPEIDVETRNKDQVLTKYIKSKKKDKKFGEPRAAHGVDQQHKKRKYRQLAKLKKGRQHKKLEEDQHKRPKKHERGLILQVDQLWLWVIDSDKIITSSSYQGDEEPDTIVRSVLRHLMEGRDLDRHPPSSPEQLMKLIVSSATGIIEQQKEIVPEKRLSLSVLEIFENAIGDIEDGELDLFRKFKKTLVVKDTLSEDYSTDEDDSSVEGYSIDGGYSIDKEIHYLVLIKDILDELNILKSLMKDQKKVWHDAFSEYRTDTKSLARDQKKGWHDALSEYTMEKDYLNSREPGEILETLEKMITDATRVERSINDLLDLKQKQANLSEAQSAREQAEATATQGTTLMVFTIVTIVFLPMSFLAALFALDITIFPHATDKLSYTPGWIFPMIFGPSAAMSIPAIYFAFHVDTAIYIWKKMKGAPRIFWRKTEHKPENKNNNGDGDAHGEPPLKHQATAVGKNDSELEKGGPNNQPSNGIIGRVKRVRVFN